MFRLIKQVFNSFILYISFNCRFIISNKMLATTRPTLTDLNPDELHYHSFMVSLGWCNESCNILDYSSN